jgi:pyruvate kinase
MAEAMRLGLLDKGDTIIAVQGWRGGLGNTNT